jgi:hypothetical protein
LNALSTLWLKIILICSNWYISSSWHPRTFSVPYLHGIVDLVARRHEVCENVEDHCKTIRQSISAYLKVILQNFTGIGMFNDTNQAGQTTV